MSFRRLIRLGVAMIASAVAGCTAASDALAPNAVSLTTGIPGGVYHPVGNAICRMFNLDGKHQETPCIAVSSDGSVENIRRVESGDSAFGLSQTDVAVAAFNGEGPFAGAGSSWPADALDQVLPASAEAFGDLRSGLDKDGGGQVEQQRAVQRRGQLGGQDVEVQIPHRNVRDGDVLGGAGGGEVPAEGGGLLDQLISGVLERDV